MKSRYTTLSDVVKLAEEKSVALLAFYKCGCINLAISLDERQADIYH
ncbi:MAG TPA: hypothetical protein VMJ32_05445 [Pirellulales bacterium]|nr:hypothetical protein [Pirellulales bacterium]